jgi:hypothetical protein
MLTGRAWERWGLLSILIGVSSLWGAVARASCAAPEPKIVWSYPADGDTDIPTNAHIFVLTSLGAASSAQPILVNGQAASQASDGTYGLAPVMQPFTDYVITVPIATPTGTTTGLTFGFKTGSGAIDGPVQPSPFKVDRVVTRTGMPTLSPACQDAVAAMDCFDTGQNTTVTFETQMRSTVFFVVPVTGSNIPWTMTWPGTCGSPEIFTNGCTGTYRIYAVNFAGMAQTADVDCANATVGAGTGASGGPVASPGVGGCSVSAGAGESSPGEIAVGILLGLGLLLHAATRGYARRGLVTTSKIRANPGPERSVIRHVCRCNSVSGPTSGSDVPSAATTPVMPKAVSD